MTAFRIQQMPRTNDCATARKRTTHLKTIDGRDFDLTTPINSESKRVVNQRTEFGPNFRMRFGERASDVLHLRCVWLCATVPTNYSK
jgi:hypothetical protein